MSTEISKILSQHTEAINRGLQSIDKLYLQEAASLLVHAIEERRNIFTIGNGASASIAQHWACDYTKGCSKIEDDVRPKVISLAANIPLMTAISNDISYDYVYSYQLERLGDPGDVLITISSSGNSPNVVEAIIKAKEMGITVISLTGFDGGWCRDHADVPLHVDVPEYEAAEDVHQAIMHMLAKYIRYEKF